MSLLIQNERVLIGSLQHLLPILIAITFGVLFIKYAQKQSTKKQHKLAHYFALFLSLTIIVFHVYQISLGGYNFQTDLPLYLCSFLALIIPIFTYFKKYWMFEILLFWIIAGTTQGIVTPDIAEGFPSFDYFRYWIVHLGLVFIMLYAVFVLKMKPRIVSVFKSIVALQVFIAVIYCINKLLNANYCYLNRKPDSASVIDYLGEWPYYILVIQLLLVPYFLLIYLPFYILERRKNN